MVDDYTHMSMETLCITCKFGTYYKKKTFIDSKMLKGISFKLILSA